jgi:hypothetical protein
MKTNEEKPQSLKMHRLSIKRKDPEHSSFASNLDIRLDDKELLFWQNIKIEVAQQSWPQVTIQFWADVDVEAQLWIATQPREG